MRKQVYLLAGRCNFVSAQKQNFHPLRTASNLFASFCVGILSSRLHGDKSTSGKAPLFCDPLVSSSERPPSLPSLFVVQCIMNVFEAQRGVYGVRSFLSCREQRSTLTSLRVYPRDQGFLPPASESVFLLTHPQSSRYSVVLDSAPPMTLFLRPLEFSRIFRDEVRR